MSDNHSTVVERRAIRHFRLFCDAPPNVKRQSIPPKAVARASRKDHRSFNTVGSSGECRANDCGRLGLLVRDLAFLLFKCCKLSPA